MSEQQAAKMLGQLTDKQIEVLDLLVGHRTSKQIARELNLAPNTVDQRITAVREKWGLPDRKTLLRQYTDLQEICGKTTYGSEAVDGTTSELEQEQTPVLDSEMLLTADSTEPIHDQVPSSSVEQPFGLQALDVKLGKLGRLVLVLIIAMGVAITFAAMLAISDALGRLL